MAAVDSVPFSVSRGVFTPYDHVDELRSKHKVYNIAIPVAEARPVFAGDEGLSMDNLVQLMSDRLYREECSINREIGSGCSSRVYSLRERESRVQRVVKIIKPASDKDQTDLALASRHFQQGFGEHLLLPIKHPDILSPDRCFYLTDGILSDRPVNDRSQMIAQIVPYFPGMSLKEWLGLRTSHTEKLLVAHQIARGMAHMCANKINHGDIHSENVLVQRNGKAAIIDFGLTHRISSDEGIVFSLGRSAYLAPEIIQFRPHTSKSEAWAFGVLLYQMHHQGRLPFVHKEKLLRGEFEMGGDVPPEIDDLIRLLLVVNPDARLSIYEAQKVLDAMVLRQFP